MPRLTIHVAALLWTASCVPTAPVECGVTPPCGMATPDCADAGVGGPCTQKTDREPWSGNAEKSCGVCGPDGGTVVLVCEPDRDAGPYPTGRWTPIDCTPMVRPWE